MEANAILEKLHSLLKTLNQIWEDDKKLLQTFFEEMRKVVYAKNAFLAFVASKQDPDSIKFIEEEPDLFSRTIILKTIDSNATIFIADTTAQASFSDSVGLIGIRSIICTPFHGSESIQGALYLDRSIPPGPFTTHECRLVEIACEQLAYIIRNSRIHREKLEERVIGAMWKQQINWGMIGQSLQMQAVFDQIHALSEEESTVLIIGETGTGKDMIARALHYDSNRGKAPFLAVHCAAIPSNLLESELFGYEPGAFSGAKYRKKGKFEMAPGGTLFLDEMGEIPLEIQVKLLRVLEERCFERLGGMEKVRMDVRIIAATNQEPREMLASGKLRLDFYQRLAVQMILVPPLRERQEDILMLSNYFIVQKNGFLKSITPQAMQKLQEYKWPGNVRELQNTMERAVFLSKDRPAIGVDDIQIYPLSPGTDPGFPNLTEDALQASDVKILIQKFVKQSLSAGEFRKPLNLDRFILERLQEYPQLSCLELCRACGYGKRAVQKSLQRLIREGKIKAVGSGKNICYCLRK